MFRPQSRRQGSVAIIAAALVLGESAADGQRQPVYRDPTIANLPRPGYEPRTIIVDDAVLEPSLDTSVTYSDNILATPDRQIDDTIVTFSPRLIVTRKTPSFTFLADLHASAIRYVVNDRENVTTFGASLEGSAPIASNQTLRVRAMFDRSFEGRSDPEAEIDRALRPALINVGGAEVRYVAQGSRVGLTATVAATKVDYLPAIDSDRDLMSYQASIRGSINAGKRMAFFVQPFINRRSFRVKVTRTGVFGDTTTTGLLAGVTFDLADKLRGEAGIGVFDANPDLAGAAGFTGIAANGRVTWQPRTRTAINLDFARGDAATIRTGALGRIDTRIALSIDQEARHNLLLRASAGLLSLHYRGGLDNDQTYLTGELEGRYLFNRHVAGIVSTNYVRRTAVLPGDRFNRWQLTAGLRMVY